MNLRPSSVGRPLPASQSSDGAGRRAPLSRIGALGEVALPTHPDFWPHLANSVLWLLLMAGVLPLIECHAADGGMTAAIHSPTGQPIISDQGKPVLQYNFHTVEPGDLLSKIAEGNRIYARARSDYLHPLHGLHGETLTRDWPVDHPHHRGIYWAWPEVSWGAQRGDLHALQHVFARPEGEPRLVSGAKVAIIEATNVWRWTNGTPLVRELARFQVHSISGRGRAVDLEFEFTALVDDLTLARRETHLYGGLNLRLATPTNQTIAVHTDLADAKPRRAWSDLSGRFEGSKFSGLTVLQHRDNPEYPGDWIQYPELSWCQPTFPSANTRFALKRETPLKLRYRLWIHEGPAPTPDEASALWDEYHR